MLQIHANVQTQPSKIYTKVILWVHVQQVGADRW